MEVYDALGRVILGAVLGSVGQGIRIVVGLKKQMDGARQGQRMWEGIFDGRKLAVSLIIAFTTGGIAGVLSAVGSLDTEITRESLLTFIAVGYAGTDFIEGFMTTRMKDRQP